MAEAESYYEPDLLDYFAERRREYQETYREEGRQEGREEGRRTLLRQAERKFGDEFGEQLVALLARVDAEGMPVVGDWIIDCATGEELLTRLHSLP